MSTIDYTCGSMLFNRIQGEHTLIFRTDIIINYCILATLGHLNTTVPIIHQNIKTSRITFTNFNNYSRFYKEILYVVKYSNTLFYEPTCTAKTK
jgi:hypothetical protein